MFAFVLTGGKTKGCENGVGVGVGVTTGAAAVVAPEVFGADAKRMPIPARTIARIIGSKGLNVI